MMKRLSDYVLAERLSKFEAKVCRHKTKRCRFCEEKILKGQFYYTRNGYVAHYDCTNVVLKSKFCQDQTCAALVRSNKSL